MAFCGAFCGGCFCPVWKIHGPAGLALHPGSGVWNFSEVERWMVGNLQELCQVTNATWPQNAIEWQIINCQEVDWCFNLLVLKGCVFFLSSFLFFHCKNFKGWQLLQWPFSLSWVEWCSTEAVVYEGPILHVVASWSCQSWSTWGHTLSLCLL